MEQKKSGEQFVVVASENLPGEFHRCTKCSEVFEGDTSLHVCPPPPSPLLSHEEINRKTLVLLVEELGEKWLKEGRGEAIHSWEEAKRKLWDNDVQYIETRFPANVLYKMVVEESKFLLKRVKEMRDAEYALNDERRSKGIPYAQRMQLIDRSKITWCDREETVLTSSLKVRPLREWFDEVELELARKLGMRWIIKTKFNQIIYG